MKKFIAGTVFGFMIAFAYSAYADDVANLVGLQVEGTVTVAVNGKEIDKQAVIIDGSSYAPVRAIGDALNLEVGYSQESGVSLKNKQLGGANSVDGTNTLTNSPPAQIPTLIYYKHELETLDLNLKMAKAVKKDDPVYEKYQTWIKEMEERQTQLLDEMHKYYQDTASPTPAP